MVGKSGNMQYQHAVQEEFLDWEEKLENLAESSEKEGWVEGGWELWKAKVIKAAEKGIGKKKVNEHSKGWWSSEVEMAIQARKEACRKLREARRTVKQDEILEEKWNTYKNKISVLNLIQIRCSNVEISPL